MQCNYLLEWLLTLKAHSICWWPCNGHRFSVDKVFVTHMVRDVFEMAQHVAYSGTHGLSVVAARNIVAVTNEAGGKTVINVCNLLNVIRTHSRW